MNPDINNNNGKINLNKFNPLPPISNIPGLNPDSDVIAAAEKKVFRKFKIHETDSSYVKLAKQGGHKNLLEYKEFGKENLSSNDLLVIAKYEKAKMPDCLEYEEKASKEPVSSPANENINSKNRKSKMCNSNNNINRYEAGAGKRLIEMKKQSKILKERPDLLPVDNTEILKHLSAPRRPVLPKIGNKSRLTSRFVRITGR